MPQHTRAAACLQDLHWLLDISPSAPPALARQCLRMGQDRIAEEVRLEHSRWTGVTTLSDHDSFALA
jgi:hypothetical protein